MNKLLLPLLLVVAAIAAPASTGQAPVAPRLRLGTYDSRAIAVAYAASKHNPVGEKMKELAAAKAAGDTRRVRELELWGEKHQRELHRQGFSRVPVDTLLATVADRLPNVASKARVDAIVWQCDWSEAAVERVDVTDEIVLLFEPSTRTLATIGELRKQPPVDLDELEKSHDH